MRGSMRRSRPTFIPGFTLSPYSNEKSLTMLFDDRKKAELQARKQGGQARPASGYSAALLDYEAPSSKVYIYPFYNYY